MTTPATYTLTLSQADVDLIGVALGELPLKQTLSLWLSLKSQVATTQALAAPIEEKAPADGNDTPDNAAGDSGQCSTDA